MCSYLYALVRELPGIGEKEKKKFWIENLFIFYISLRFIYFIKSELINANFKLEIINF